MAEITLDIDKAGNVTVVSTWVDEYLYSSWEGEQLIQEFNNYYVCVMPIEYYVEDLSQIYNASWYEFDVPCVGGWINNFFYNVNPEFNTYDKAAYAEGVNEKWEFKATVEEIIDALDWGGTLTYDGNSFMVLVIPTDPQAYGALMLDQALAVPFKQLNVNVEVVETTWNNAYFNATLRGANAYQFNINNKADLENQIANGWYADFETYYNDYIFYWQNYGSSFGSHRVATDVAGENISFNDLINYGEEYPYWFEMAPNTTYIVAILAEEDGKTEYTYEDLKIIEFTTKDVVAAATPFEYTIELDTEDTTYFNIYANVTVPETAVAVYSRWYDEEFLSEEELKADLINNGWMKTDFTSGYTYELSTFVDAAATPKYLGILIIDAEGTENHLAVRRVLYLATYESHCTREVNLASVEETSDEDYLLSTYCPHNLALVHRSCLVDLDTHITCRMRAFEDCCRYVLGYIQSCRLLAGTQAKMYRSDA